MSGFRVIWFLTILTRLCGETKASCYSNLNCLGTNVCCQTQNEYECSSNCIGKSCYFNSDCGGYNEYCCDETCQEGSCPLEGWVIAVIVCSVVGVIFVIIGVVFYYVFRSRRNPGVIVATPYNRMPTTTVINTASNHIAYPNAFPQPVQQPMPSTGAPPPYYSQQPQPTALN